MQVCHKIYTYKNEKDKQNLVLISKILIWNKEKKMLTLDDKEIKLTKKEILLIDILSKKKNILFTAEELMNVLWTDAFHIETDIKNLKNIISRLRKKVPTLHIANIYGLGYKLSLAEDVELDH